MVMHPFEKIIKAASPLPCKNIPVHICMDICPQFHRILDSQWTISVMDYGLQTHSYIFVSPISSTELRTQDRFFIYVNMWLNKWRGELRENYSKAYRELTMCQTLFWVIFVGAHTEVSQHLWGKHYYYSHFMAEETKAPKTLVVYSSLLS